MRKFTTSVCMKCTQEQFEKDLKEPLKSMGYGTGQCFKFDIYEYLYSFHDIESISTGRVDFLREYKDMYFIDHYNPSMYLALAAMSEGDEFYPGEYVVHDFRVGLGKITTKKGDNDLYPDSYACQFDRDEIFKTAYVHDKYIRKATREEIIKHFTMETKTEKWEPKNGEVIEVKMNKENDWVIGWYVGMDDEYFVVKMADQSFYRFAYARPLSKKITVTNEQARQILADIKGISPDLIVIEG